MVPLKIRTEHLIFNAMLKKFVFIAAIAAIAASCSKEIEKTVVSGDENTVNPASVVFTAGIDTKAAISGSEIVWEDGDQLTLWNGTQTATYSTTDSGSSATFTTSDSFDAAASYTAIYPADGSAVFSAGSVTTTLPTVQSATDGNFDPAAHIAVATTTTTDLAFHNAVAYLKFSVPTGMDDLVSVTFAGNNSEKVAGACSVNTGSYALTATGSATAKLSGTFDEGHTYYLAIAPQNFSKGYTVTIERTSRTYDMVSTKDVTINRNDARNIGELWDGSILLEGSAIASATPMTIVASASGRVQIHQVYSFRGDLSAGKLNVRKAYSSSAFESNIDIPVDGNYHVMYNMTTGRFRVYSQDIFVDLAGANDNGTSGTTAAPWNLLKNVGNSDDIAAGYPNYAVADYYGNATSVHVNTGAFTTSNNNGVGGDDKALPIYILDDEEYPKGALYDGLNILHATGANSDTQAVVISGLSNTELYDIRVISTRANATPSARKTRFVVKGASTSAAQDIFQGWKIGQEGVTSASNISIYEKNRRDFDGIAPDGEGKLEIQVTGIDTGTRADAHFSAFRIAKVVYSHN